MYKNLFYGYIPFIKFNLWFYFVKWLIQAQSVETELEAVPSPTDEGLRAVGLPAKAFSRALESEIPACSEIGVY